VALRRLAEEEARERARRTTRAGDGNRAPPRRAAGAGAAGAREAGAAGAREPGAAGAGAAGAAGTRAAGAAGAAGAVGDSSLRPELAQLWERISVLPRETGAKQAAGAQAAQPPPSSLSHTNRTSLVPPLVLSGHAASLTQGAQAAGAAGAQAASGAGAQDSGPPRDHSQDSGKAGASSYPFRPFDIPQLLASESSEDECAPPPPPSLVLSGHAESLTP